MIVEGALQRFLRGEAFSRVLRFTMEVWEITVNPKAGTLGLEGLKRREFTEY